MKLVIHFQDDRTSVGHFGQNWPMPLGSKGKAQRRPFRPGMAGGGNRWPASGGSAQPATGGGSIPPVRRVLQTTAHPDILGIHQTYVFAA